MGVTRLRSGTPNPGPEAPKSGGSLSERLERSDGVIKPQHNLDPEMRLKPPPIDHSMPVIPPPGSPGSDSNVQPK